MICNIQARLVQLKSNKALSVPRKKMQRNKCLKNGKQNLILRRANLVFQSLTAKIIHIQLLSFPPFYYNQTRGNFKSLLTKQKECRNTLVRITLFRCPVSFTVLKSTWFMIIIFEFYTPVLTTLACVHI